MVERLFQLLVLNAHALKLHLQLCKLNKKVYNSVSNYHLNFNGHVKYIKIDTNTQLLLSNFNGYENTESSTLCIEET